MNTSLKKLREAMRANAAKPKPPLSKVLEQIKYMNKARKNLVFKGADSRQPREELPRKNADRNDL